MSGWYFTTYPMRGSIYGTHLWARSATQARCLAKARKIGEKVESNQPFKSAPYEPASTLLNKRKPDPVKVWHAATYLSWLALSSGVLSTADALSDKGVLHELAHYFLFGPIPPVPKRKVLVENLRELERKVPGYWSP